MLPLNKTLYNLVLTIILLASCNLPDESQMDDHKLNLAGLDSIQFIIMDKNNPYDSYPIIHYLSESIDTVSDNSIKAKMASVLAHYYISVFDLEKTIKYHQLTKRILLAQKKYDETLYIDKVMAMGYRQGGKLDSIEPLLLGTMDLIKEKNINSYQILYPIHELAVHYAYDMNNYPMATEYGELFFSELNKVSPKDSSPNAPSQKDYKKIIDMLAPIVHLELGKCYVEIGDYKKGKYHLDRANEAYGSSYDYEKLSRLYKNYSTYFIKTGDYESANNNINLHFKMHQRAMDTLVRKERAIADIKEDYMERLRELKESKEKEKRNLIIGSVTFFLVILIFLFVIRSIRLHEAKKRISIKLKKETEFNELKSFLFMKVAHEIRTPLTLILGYLELYLNSDVSQKKSTEYYNEIRENCNRALSKASRTIELMKSNQIEVQVEHREFVLEPVLRRCFFSFESAAKIKSMSLHYDVQLPKAFTLYSDQEKLESILINLIENALKYSGRDTKVSLKGQIDKNNLILSVSDQGVGIDSSEIAHVFNLEYRSRATNQIDGHGIGLAIVKKLTEALDGTIHVESKRGEGCTFILNLPIKKELVHTYLEPENIIISYDKEENRFLGKNAPNTHGTKLLIVDDNPYMCQYYETILSHMYDCTYATHGKEAIQIIQQNSFDLILSDVMMPIMDGFTFREWVLASDYKDLPFIMVTAVDLESYKIKAFRLGIDDYVIKPFSKEELGVRIARLFQNRGVRNQVSKEILQEGELDILESAEEKLLSGINAFILENLDDETLKINDLAKGVGVSKRQLIRIMKKMTGLTPNKYILEARLQQAYKKIKNKEEFNVKTVMYSVGITSPSYFSTKFKERFGIAPSEL